MKNLIEVTTQDLIAEITRVSRAISLTRSDNIRVDYIKYLSRLGHELERRKRVVH